MAGKQIVVCIIARAVIAIAPEKAIKASYKNSSAAARPFSHTIQKYPFAMSIETALKYMAYRKVY